MSASTSKAGGASTQPQQGLFPEPGTFDVDWECQFSEEVEEMYKKGERLRTGQDPWADELAEEARRQRENDPLEQAINKIVDALIPKGTIEQMVLQTQAADAYSHRLRPAKTAHESEGTLLDFNPREAPVFP